MTEQNNQAEEFVAKLEQYVERFEAYLAREKTDPLFYPRLLRHLWERAVSYAYFMASALMLIPAERFARGNPFEHGQLPRHLSPTGELLPSPVLCVTCLLIAVFLFAQGYRLDKKHQSENET